MTRHSSIRGLLAVWAITVAAPVAAQAPAATPLSIIVPYPAGGVSDVLARAIAPTLGRILGRTTIVENLPGASGSIAANRLLAAPANGSTLFIGSPTEVVLAPVTLKTVKYQASDFRLLGLLTEGPLAVYVRSSLPVASIDELMTHSRQNADKPLSYGSTGIGSIYHLATEELKTASGLNAVHIPYRGGSALLQDLMGGNVDMAMFPAVGAMSKLVESGRMKAIAVAAPVRSARFPSVATFAESKSLPRFSTQNVWAGVLVPATTPEALVVQLHKALAETLATPEVRQAVEAAGDSLPAPLSLAQAAAFYQGEAGKLIAAAKLAKLEPN